jgi:hypothetical protein
VEVLADAALSFSNGMSFIGGKESFSELSGDRAERSNGVNHTLLLPS